MSQPVAHSMPRSSRVAVLLGGLRMKCAQIMGVSVSDTTVQTATAKASVTENSRNTRPTTPLMNRSGIKAAISEIEIATTVKPIWRAPSSAALIGGMPFSMLRKPFSIITIASSTTKPTEQASAKRERLLIEKPTHDHPRGQSGAARRDAATQARAAGPAQRAKKTIQKKKEKTAVELRNEK